MGISRITEIIRLSGPDASAEKQKAPPGTAKRMWRFAVPYANLLSLFFFLLIVSAGISIVNPLIYRQIINNGIFLGNIKLIVRFAVLASIVGLLGSALGLVQSYLAATIGARIVLALRTKLFEHVQQMPLAFFERVQTGALVS